MRKENLKIAMAVISGIVVVLGAFKEVEAMALLPFGIFLILFSMDMRKKSVNAGVLALSGIMFLVNLSAMGMIDTIIWAVIFVLYV